MSDRISGVILFDETIRQKAADGTPLVKVIEKAGSIPGIKVDKGTKPLPFSPGETITDGLDGLRERLIEYRDLGAKFCKWRAVIDIGPGIPSYNCINANAHALAPLCRAVPGGEFGADRRARGAHGRRSRDWPLREVTEFVLKTVFQELYYARVKLEGMVLKPNMVVPGKKSAKQASDTEIAERTLRVLRLAFPPPSPASPFFPAGSPTSRRRRGSTR